MTFLGSISTRCAALVFLGCDGEPTSSAIATDEAIALAIFQALEVAHINPKDMLQNVKITRSEANVCFYGEPLVVVSKAI
jgi:hypothetical protein